jgi:hypothetical protein
MFSLATLFFLFLLALRVDLVFSRVTPALVITINKDLTVILSRPLHSFRCASDVVSEYPDAREILRYHTWSNVDDSIVVQVDLALLREVLEICREIIVEAVSVSTCLLGRPFMALWVSDIFNVDPEKLVEELIVSFGSGSAAPNLRGRYSCAAKRN